MTESALLRWKGKWRHSKDQMVSQGRAGLDPSHHPGLVVPGRWGVQAPVVGHSVPSQLPVPAPCRGEPTAWKGLD